MKGRQLLDAMAYIDDVLIEEAAPFLEDELTNTEDFTGKRRKWKGITACAAVFAVAAVSLWVWKSGIVTQQRTVLENGQNAGAYVESSYEGADTGAQNIPEETFAAEFKENGINDAAALKENDNGRVMVTDGIAADDEAVMEEEAVQGAAKEAAQDLKGENVRVIEEFSLPAVYCYAVPKKGSCVIFAGLEAAIDYYDNGNKTVEPAKPERVDCYENENNTAGSEKMESYLYHVAIDVFGEADSDGSSGSMDELRYSEEGKEKLYQEYERMLSLGLNVSLSEEYELTGTLSREEIEGFEPIPDYGYTFRLINES